MRIFSRTAERILCFMEMTGMKKHTVSRDEMRSKIINRGYYIGFWTIIMYLIIVFSAEVITDVDFVSGGVAAWTGFYLTMGIVLAHNIICKAGVLFIPDGNEMIYPAVVFLILSFSCSARMMGHLTLSAGSYITDGKLNYAAAELIGLSVTFTLGILSLQRFIENIKQTRKFMKEN